MEICRPWGQLRRVAEVGDSETLRGSPRLRSEGAEQGPGLRVPFVVLLFGLPEGTCAEVTSLICWTG
jgi:hypothetical protein